MTATTWPDPARPGAPFNPKKGGWHWLSGVLERPAAFEWLAHKQAWLFHRAQPEAQAMLPHDFRLWTYLGPVLTPDEATALQKRIAELEAALREINDKDSHPSGSYGPFAEIARAALEGGKRDERKA